jgi:hypothetical protein
MTVVDLQPETDTVLQSEAYAESAVNVCVESVKTPVRTQELPHKAGATRYRNVGTTAIRVLAADHFRAHAYITSFDQDIFVAFNQTSAQDSSRMSRWPAVVPMVITTDTEVWVASFQATTNVSITTELWATGD